MMATRMPQELGRRQVLEPCTKPSCASIVLLRHRSCRSVSLRSVCLCMHCWDRASVTSSLLVSWDITVCSRAVSSKFSRVSSTRAICLSSSCLHCAATWLASTAPGTQGVRRSAGGSRQISRSVNILKSSSSAARRLRPPCNREEPKRVCSSFSKRSAARGGPALSPIPGSPVIARQQLPKNAKASPTNLVSWHRDQRPRGQSRANSRRPSCFKRL
mmetsp:Transcript_112835/g.319112  ORF Transcript_112835/g.319112 Transcript_112835/m.319112 type:complete len:216 (-) Transcript_112835:1949-2596(-)